MQVWHQILQKAWDDTWEKVVGQTAITIVIATLIFAVAFILARRFRGKDYASDWLFDAAIGVAGIVVVAAIVFLVEALIVVPVHMVGDEQSKTGDLAKTVDSLSVSNGNLLTQNSTLQKTVDKDESALKAVAIIAGVTNGTIGENLWAIPAKIDEMQRDLKGTKDRLFAEQKEETISYNETNRITIFTSMANHGPIVFFRLKHAAIEGSIHGTVQLPVGAYPLVGVMSEKNVLWLTFTDLSGWENSKYIFDYAVDASITNLVKNVWTNNGEIFLDRAHLILNLPQDD